MEKELFKLSWFNWVTSHSSWEASKIKTSKTNRWIIIVINYQIWPSKHFWVCNHFGRQATIFFDKSISEFLTLALLKHRITKQSFNINDNNDNNEKTKKQEKLKTQVEIFKNMDRNIPGGNFLVGNFPGWGAGGIWWLEISKWEFSGWEFSSYRISSWQWLQHTPAFCFVLICFFTVDTSSTNIILLTYNTLKREKQDNISPVDHLVLVSLCVLVIIGEHTIQR